MPEFDSVQCTVNKDDYVVLDYVQEGATGKVYCGLRSRDGGMVAMKFFGYTKRRPISHEIQHEIDLLRSLKGVSGIVQMEGVFFDTAEGILPNKRYHEKYPVIVSEWLRGGALFDKISTQLSVSEKYLAGVFRRALLGLNNLHKHNLLHRDIKLENLMLAGVDEDSEIRLIDLGLCVSIPPESSTYVATRIQGTAGCYAPETITRKLYSTKTDIWQMGCMLYAMLSGMLPFHPDYPAQITRGKFFEMKGTGWDGISDEAKDLVKNLLRRNPRRRYGIAEALNHPWMIRRAPAVHMDTAYLARIKSLSLRQQLRSFFLRNDIETGHRERRDRVHRIFPFLRATVESVGSVDVEAMSLDPAQSQSQVEHRSTVFSDKLQNMKKLIIRSYSQGSTSSEDTDKSRCLSRSSSTSLSRSIAAGKISYGVFVSLLLQCQLPELARPEVFSIFDIDGGGTIDMKEFLLALLAFQPATVNEYEFHRNSSTRSINDASDDGVDSKDGDLQGAFALDETCGSPLETHPYIDDEAAARLYFQVFDIDNSGTISIEELRFVVACLLQGDGVGSSGMTPPNRHGMLQSIAEGQVDGETGDATMTPSSPGVPYMSIDELFASIDVTSTGEITFEEFLVFYHAVMRYSTSRSRSTTSLRLDSERIKRALSGNGSQHIQGGSIQGGSSCGDIIATGRTLCPCDLDGSTDSSSDEEDGKYVRMLDGRRAHV